MTHPSIQPLPEAVIAQIQSSTAIVSLTAVVIELLKNSLDARATKIDVTVDFGRGGCSIEDNGLGIAPAEFRQNGGLGRMYYTSKYKSENVVLGKNGTFLASLAALSLLTITSHHHQHRSHNTLICHQAKTTERLLPTPAHYEIRSYPHGTRVTVRNLFGNLPVRVKQRAVIVEEKPEKDRLWEGLKKDVTSLLLGWEQPVCLRIRDADNRTIININLQSATGPRSYQENHDKARSTQFQILLNTLTQAGYISYNDWEFWVPVSASTSTMSIKGAISLEPAPTRNVQFISFDYKPLSSHTGHNELYNVVNRVFSLSSFGAAEDDLVIDEREKLRRENDGRYKSDGFTNRQLRGSRKSVDKWPMFYFRICFQDQNRSDPANETNLQAVSEILDALVTQWLDAHHFRPRKRKPTLETSESLPTPSDEDVDMPKVSGRKKYEYDARHGKIDKDSSRRHTSRRDSLCLGVRKRKRSTPSVPTIASKPAQSQFFTSWSRIKSSNSRSYDTIWKTGEVENRNTTITCRSPSIGAQVSRINPPVLNTPSPDQDAVISGGTRSSPGTITADPGKEAVQFSEEHEDTIRWMDPSTNQSFLLDSRTGCVLPSMPKQSQSNSLVPSSVVTLADFNKSLRLQHRKSRDLSCGTNTPWLDDVLRTWDNPVFKLAQRRIPGISHDEAGDVTEARSRSGHFGCTLMNINAEFEAASQSKPRKFSKESLRDAQVISQLDKKFILAKMPGASSSASNGAPEAEFLVLIDQHAADERIRVEALFSELSTPVCNDSVSPQCHSAPENGSQIGFVRLEEPPKFCISARESELFLTHAARLAAWGILYDVVSQPSTSEQQENVQHILSILALPGVISGRCKADPKLLITFLRSEIWKYAESNHLPPVSAGLATSSSLADDDGASWVQRLATCPEGLIDLVNSRACRSAIMFNDELTVEECRTLVKKLARCVFPFKCAHWRPSMVPLVELGSRFDIRVEKTLKDISDPPTGFGEDSCIAKSNFVSSWTSWRKEQDQRKGEIEE